MKFLKTCTSNKCLVLIKVTTRIFNIILSDSNITLEMRVTP